MCLCLCMKKCLCVNECTHTNRLCRLNCHQISGPAPFSEPPKYARQCNIYPYHCHQSFLSISELPPLSSMPSYTIKSAQRESTEREQNKPPVIWGTKASITQGKIGERLTFLNRTISSTGARYHLLYLTQQINSSLLLFVMSPLSLYQGEKEIVWDNKRTNKWREVRREGEWTGNHHWNGVFLWGDFKWQCNRCPPKGWLGLIVEISQVVQMFKPPFSFFMQEQEHSWHLLMSLDL